MSAWDGIPEKPLDIEVTVGNSNTADFARLLSERIDGQVMHTSPQQGWQCPLCRTVLAPHVDRCTFAAALPASPFIPSPPPFVPTITPWYTPSEWRYIGPPLPQTWCNT